MHAAAALASLLTAALPVSPSVAHVRSTDSRLIDRMKDGCRRSPTMRSLVDELEASDVFVYVEAAGRPGGGSLQFVEATPHGRYVRVAVDVDLDAPRLIAVIAHELRHALEIAGAADVADPASMEAFYTRIGTRRARCGGRPVCYETAAATQTTAIVFREICGRSVPPDGIRTHW